MKAFAVLALLAVLAAAYAQAPVPQKAEPQPNKDLKGSEAVYLGYGYAAPYVASYGYAPYAYASPYAYAAPYAYPYLYK